MKVIVVIPARGGSERLPRKNIYPIWGKPMLYWAIRASQMSRYINDIYVSSEDDEILDLAKSYGVNVIKRDISLSQSHIFKQDVIVDAVKKLTYKPDIVVSLQPNSPEVSPIDIDGAIDKLIKHDRNEIFTVDSDLIQNAAFRIMKYDYVFQKSISTKSGVFVTYYKDVHKKEDVEYLEKHSCPFSLHHWRDGLYDGDYLNDAKKIKRTNNFFEIISSKMTLNDKSRIIEMGCNLARNLEFAFSHYGCDITGVDINGQALESAKKRIGKGTFIHGDLSNGCILKSFRDKEFDLAFTMGFLMHIPSGDNKKHLIHEILRISKRSAFFELYDENSRITLRQNNNYVLSFDEYRLYDESIKLTDFKENNLRLFLGGEW